MLTPLYQWLRGQLTDLGAEFTRLSDSLAACPGAQGGILATVTRSSTGSVHLLTILHLVPILVLLSFSS